VPGPSRFSPAALLRRQAASSDLPVPARYPDAYRLRQPPHPFGPFGKGPLPRYLHAASYDALQAPGVPYSPSPADVMTVDRNPLLTWISLRGRTYDIKFGTVNPPTIIVSANQLVPFFQSVAPDAGFYYWQVIAKNQAGSTNGPVWSFYVVPQPAIVVDSSALYDPHISQTNDISQVRTRVYVKGAGSTLVHDEPAGTTTLELQDTSMFSALGGMAIVGPWRIRYTGKVDSIVGDGGGASGSGSSSPSAPNTIMALTQAGQLVSGRVKQPVLYKVSNTIEVAGTRTETELSDAGNTLIMFPFQTTYTGDGSGVNVTQQTGGQIDPGPYSYHVSSYTDDGEAYAGNASGAGTSLGLPFNAFLLDFGSAFQSTDPRIRGFKVWRSSLKYTGPGGIPRYMLLASVGPNASGVITDRLNDDSLSTFATINPVTNLQFDGYNTTGSRVVVQVPVGPAGTVARTIYRAKVGLFTGIVGTYERIGTINDNLPSSGVYNDGTVVAINQPAHTIYIDNSDTGWPLFTGNESSAGDGTGTNPTVPPPLHHLLVGVSGVAQAVTAGTPVNIWVQRDDLSAQIALAQLEGGDGIHEYLVTDTTLISDAMCVARGDAELALFSRAIVTVRYATRDQNVHAGRFVTFNIANPPITGTLLVQEVTVDMIRATPQDLTFAPRRDVIASSVKFSLTDLLRKTLLSR
jgi:hypothetical protein